MKHKRKGLFSEHRGPGGYAVTDIERNLKYKVKSTKRRLGNKVTAHENPVSKILDTNGSIDFIKGRKYDTDMDRLMRKDVQNEMQKGTNQLNKEMRKEMREYKRDVKGY